MSNDTLTIQAAVLVELNRSHKKKQTALQTTVIITKKDMTNHSFYGVQHAGKMC